MWRERVLLFAALDTLADTHGWPLLLVDLDHEPLELVGCALTAVATTYTSNVGVVLNECHQMGNLWRHYFRSRDVRVGLMAMVGPGKVISDLQARLA